MKRVLVPVDGSATSTRAVAHIVEQRTRYQDPGGIEIHLLNVQRPVSGDVGMFVSKEDVNQYHHDKGMEALRPARELLDKAGVAYVVHVGLGDPAEIIVHYAKEKQCDQIVIGTHGHTGLAHLLLGSVASDVVRLAGIPVTLIK